MAKSLQSNRIVIAGGSGFLGISLASHLAASGAEVVLLSRHPSRVSGPWRHVSWDGRKLGDWQHELEGASGLVNLAGRSVDCVKTPENQDEILRSRIEATRALGMGIRHVTSPPAVWVQMSTAHIYGDPPEVVCTESSPFGFGLAPFVGQVWEKEFRSCILPSQRAVTLRTSFVIGRDRGAGCGALARLTPLAKWGLGGAVGSGKQGVSWIHEKDLNRLFERALTDPSMRGEYIASAPNPVSNRAFMRALRQSVGMPIGLPATPSMVRFASHWLLHTDPELALYGRYVRSQRLQDEQFKFRFPEVGAALRDLLHPSLNSVSD